MIDNPFLSDTYQKIWINHFANASQIKQVDFVGGLNFYKASWLPLYMNCGKNMTNGITYHFTDAEGFIKDSALLIFDVSSYHDVVLASDRYRLKKIPQYAGHLLNLKEYDSMNTFLGNHFNAKSRSKFRGYFNKLEKNHVVDYEVLGESISHQDYLRVMKAFKKLLETRFDDLGLENDILLKWSFYEALIYPMLKEKKALLNLIRVDGEVGAISLAFLSKDSVIGAIKAFDISYKNYSLGVLELMKLIEWSIDSGFAMFDFSKGDQDYKKRFTSDSYIFNCHVIYDSKNLVSKLTAKGIIVFYSFKQYLREKGFNTWYWKLKHKLKLN